MTRKYRIILSVASGILLSLAWLRFPGWTLFFAFFPLLLVENYFVQKRKDFRVVSFWGHALLAFLVWNIITTWWISHATVVGAILAILANSFLMSVVWWLGHAARRHFSSNLGYVALIVFWISFEYFHYNWDIEWPWLNLGNGFANSIKIVQWYEYTGTLGGSLWVLVLNIFLFRTYLELKSKSSLKQTLIPALSFVLILTVPAVASIIMYFSYTEKENSLEVVIIQPNIDPYSEDYDQNAEYEKLQGFLQLAESAVTEKTNLVIGPETLFERWPDWNADKLENNPIFIELAEWSWKYPGAEVIFGASTHKIYPDAQSASSTSRVSDGTYFDVFNSAVFIDRNGSGHIYHKSILVSGVEKMPLRKYLAWLNDVVFDLGGTTGSLGRQEEPSNFVLKNGIEAAPVICYESVFGEYLTQFVRKGADFIVVITNDGWWKNTPGYRQHLSFSRLRAVETRRSVARSANTGISCFINQRGDVFQPTPWWEETAINGTINLNDELTFYVRYGDYIARISIFTSVMLLLFLGVKQFIRK